ncbi:MAG: secondary thiamine-phosphate synthase enzyme YjbQ [Gammaproteobacteria bacterium]|nr:secondary thiamine-phosphate synthase enzyme YjbQ [Gammaproteobacteria bacterium]
MVHQQQLRFSTDGRGTYNITQQISDVISKSGVMTGICQVFIHHTSASLILCENADPTVRTDLDAFMKRLVPDGDSLFKHQDEGPDDMPAHIRTILTESSLSIPINKGKENLGIWQGIFLWEHRTSTYKRNVTVTVIGE